MAILFSCGSGCVKVNKFIIEILKRYLGNYYRLGVNYPKYLLDCVYVRNADKNTNKIVGKFKVESEYNYDVYNVTIRTKEMEVTSVKCNCNEFRIKGLCRHVAASMCYYGRELFVIDEKVFSKRISKFLISDFVKKRETTSNVKQEMKLEVIMEIGNYNQVNIKIGFDRMYLLRNKVNPFFECYYGYSKDKVVFGKQLEYSSDKYFFNDVDSQILDLVYYVCRSGDYNVGYRGGSVYFDDVSVKKLMELVRDKGLSITGVGYISHISDEIPFSPILRKDNDDYVFDLNMDSSEIMPVTGDFEYVAYRGNCYHLPANYSNLLSVMMSNEVSSLVFDKSDVSNFSQGVLPIVKDEITVSDNIDDIVVVKKPAVELYFDLNYNDVVCNVKFNYANVAVDYFDVNENIMRDVTYEEKVINDLKQLNFVIDNKRLVLDDLDDIGYLLEEGLQTLDKDYSIFTSNRLKEVTVVRGSAVQSSFAIGKDNIMSFKFSMDNVTSSELEKILDSYRRKKKYYRLKSGDIINIADNNDLGELNSLTEDMNLSSKDIRKGKVELPKYRAIYLDSLKNDKYHIVKTNNLFDQFIDKFKKYKDIELDTTNDSVLRDYQKIGVKWLYNIYKCELGCILADEMGLGKSIQVIYLIKQILREKADSKIFIVSPTSLVYNWGNEFEKFGSEIAYKVYGQSKNVRHEMLKSDEVSVYITSYGLLREDLDIYKEMGFELMVIDEAQMIKNTNAGVSKATKEIKANIKMALTGTPIENSTMELYSIFDYIMPGFLGNETDFRRKYSIKDFNEDTNRLLVQLNNLISPFILRRRKKDVLTELPDKIENNIYIDLTSDQKKLYAAEVKRVREEMDKLIQTQGFMKARFLILQLLTKLRQLCIDPRIIYDNYKGGSAKIESLIDVVKDTIKNGHKILLFTSFKTALEIVKKEFDKAGITSYQIDGSVSSSKRIELVNKFNNDDTNVFLIMLKSGGTGLNLTSATVVIHLDLWWNPQAENQATDRAHRIGQTEKVEVVKLISRGTIEERILELQEKKKKLSDALIEGDNRDSNVLSTLDEKDIRKLLSFEQEK